MPSARSTFLELATITSVVVLLAFAPLFVEIGVDRSCGPDEVPVPALLEMKHAYADTPWIVIPGVATLVLLGALRALPRLRDRKLAHKLLVLGGAAATQAVLVVMLGLLSLTLDPNWLFGHARPSLKLPSPDGSKVAWATHGCFFKCGWTVYAQDKGAWKMKKVSQVPAGESKEGAALEWSADSKDVRLVVTP